MRSSHASRLVLCLAAIGCGSARPPVGSPAGPPPAPRRTHPGPSPAPRARLRVEGDGAWLEWPPGERTPTGPLRASLGDALLPPELEAQLPVAVSLGPDVVSTLAPGEHRADEVRRALFAVVRERRELRAGEHTLTLVATGDLPLDGLSEELRGLSLPPGHTLVALGGEPHVGEGFVVLEGDNPAARRSLLSVLLRPRRGPPWLRSVVAQYLTDRYLLRRGGDGLAWLLSTYRAHRTHLGIAIAEGDLEGGLLAAFCFEARGHRVELPLSEPTLRRLEATGALRLVLDLDACLRPLGSQLTARTVRHFEPASLQRLFGGVLEGQPPTLRRRVGGGALRSGDVLTHLGDRPVETLADVEDALQELAPGQRIRARVRRGDTERRVWLRVPELEVARKEVRFEALPSPTSHPRWPFSAQPPVAEPPP